MKKILGIVAALALMVGAPLQADAAFGIKNGSFVTSPANAQFQTLQPEPEVGGVLADWGVGPNSVDLLKTYFSPYPDATPGAQAIDLAGGGPGSIFQTLDSLIIGQDYTISFWIGRNTDAPNQAPYPDPAQRINVTFGSLTSSFLFTGTGPGWQQKTFTFTALTTTDLLTFSANGQAGPYGGLLSNVSIAATPEPTTIVVWSGLAAIGGIVAYRRRATV